MNYYAALDVSLRSVNICVIDEQGEIRAEAKLASAALNECIDLEQEIRGLFKVFGIKLPPTLGHGAFDKTVRNTIEADPALSHAFPLGYGGCKVMK